MPKTSYAKLITGGSISDGSFMNLLKRIAMSLSPIELKVENSDIFEHGLLKLAGIDGALMELCEFYPAGVNNADYFVVEFKSRIQDNEQFKPDIDQFKELLNKKFGEGTVVKHDQNKFDGNAFRISYKVMNEKIFPEWKKAAIDQKQSGTYIAPPPAFKPQTKIAPVVASEKSSTRQRYYAFNSGSKGPIFKEISPYEVKELRMIEEQEDVEIRGCVKKKLSSILECDDFFFYDRNKQEQTISFSKQAMTFGECELYRKKLINVGLKAVATNKHVIVINNSFEELAKKLNINLNDILSTGARKYKMI